MRREFFRLEVLVLPIPKFLLRDLQCNPLSSFAKCFQLYAKRKKTCDRKDWV